MYILNRYIIKLQTASEHICFMSQAVKSLYILMIIICTYTYYKVFLFCNTDAASSRVLFVWFLWFDFDVFMCCSLFHSGKLQYNYSGLFNFGANTLSEPSGMGTQILWHVHCSTSQLLSRPSSRSSTRQTSHDGVTFTITYIVIQCQSSVRVLTFFCVVTVIYVEKYGTGFRTTDLHQ